MGADAGGTPQHGSTPLVVAALGHVEVAQVLLEAGADTEATGQVRARWGGGVVRTGVVSLVSWRSCRRGLLDCPTLHVGGNTGVSAPKVISIFFVEWKIILNGVLLLNGRLSETAF